MAEPANPPGLTKPTAEDLEQLANGIMPDLMHKLAQVQKVEKSLLGPGSTIADHISAAALRRLVNAATWKCVWSIDEAMVMHCARKPC
jgi:hypothetical protein